MSNTPIKDYGSFNPTNYLNEYYSEVEDENQRLLTFFAKVYKKYETDSLDVVEIGGGPTIYQLISLAVPAKKILFTDYVEANLLKVQSWLRDDSIFDWDKFIYYALKAESPGHDVSDQDIVDRKNLIKNKIVRFEKCDIFADSILPLDKKFDLISTNFVTESVCSNKNEVKDVITKLKNLIKPGGKIVMTGLLGADYWHSGESTFVAARLNEDDVKSIFEHSGISIEYLETIKSQFERDDPDFQGYDGMFMLVGSIPSDG